MYALTIRGAELREPIESLIRWSTPLMVRGPDGDRFRAEWLRLALPALLGGRVAAGHPSTVGIAVDDVMVQVRAPSSGIEVSLHDGRDLDAVVRADPSVLLGLPAGALTLDEARGLIDIEGDEKAVRAIFDAQRIEAEGSARR